MERVRAQVELHPEPSAAHIQVSEIPESWEMDFLLPEKSKEPHGEDAALPTWESLDRTMHICSHAIGSKVLGTLEILQFCLAGMSLGGRGRSWQRTTQRSVPACPFQWALREDSKQRVVAVLPPRDGPAATAQGMMSRVGI